MLVAVVKALVDADWAAAEAAGSVPATVAAFLDSPFAAGTANCLKACSAAEAFAARCALAA
jgi:hypothetical protein